MLDTVSVVIPHYGSPIPAEALIRQLQEQTYDGGVEIVVVDDASPEPFPDRRDIHVVRSRINRGFGSAVNAGAAIATNEYLLVMNSDVTVAPTFLQDLLSAAEPWMPAVVSPRVTTTDGGPVWGARRFPQVRHHFAEWLTPLAAVRPTAIGHTIVGHDTWAASRSTSSPVDWLVGAVLLMPLAAFRVAGGFDERFFMNAEETDLQLRLRRVGVPSVLLAGPTAEHEGGASSDPDRRRTWLVRSRRQYAEKWGRAGRLHAALLSATAVNLAWNAVRRLAGRDIHPWTTARKELELLRGATR